MSPCARPVSLLLGAAMPTVALPLGDAGVRATLRTMARLARDASRQPSTRLAAVGAVRYAGPLSMRQRDALGEWLATRVSFLRDPDGVELLHAPTWALRQIATYGAVNFDCDDAAVLAAAMGLAIGLRARFVALAFVVPGRVGLSPYSHVYAELASPTLDPPDWTSLDVTANAQRMASVQVQRRLVQAV